MASIAKGPWSLVARTVRCYLLPIVGDPHWDRGAPEAVARNGPVACVGNPVVEALLLDKIGYLRVDGG